MKKVAILGAGPAGLMAAYAASLCPGTFVSIFTQGDDSGPTRSKLGGAQFLHVPLPGDLVSQEPDGVITYRLAGEHMGYQTKVYGAEPVPFVSMERVRDGQEVPAWSLSGIYDRLWEYLITGSEHRVNVVDINAAWLIDLCESGTYDHIICTLPRTAVCLGHAGLIERSHTFVSQTIRIRNECAFSESLMPDGTNTIWYDGTRNVSWYRTSMIFGVGSTEWGEGAPEKLPYDRVVKAVKPLRTDCNCFNDHVIFAGRYGRWAKGVLTHDGFIKAWEAIAPERSPA